MEKNLFKRIMKKIEEEEFLLSFNPETQDDVRAYSVIGHERARYEKSPIRGRMLKAHVARILTFTDALEDLAQEATRRVDRRTIHDIINNTYKTFYFTPFVQWPFNTKAPEFIPRKIADQLPLPYSPLNTRKVSLEEILILRPGSTHNLIKVCEPYNLLYDTIADMHPPMNYALRVYLNCAQTLEKATQWLNDTLEKITKGT